MLIKISDALGKELSFVLEEKKYVHPEGEEKYCLKIFDDTILVFGLYEDVLSGLQAEVYHVNEKMTDLLPMDMELTGSGLIKWLGNRVIPKNTVAGS